MTSLRCIFSIAPRVGVQFVAPDAIGRVGSILRVWLQDGVITAMKTSDMENHVHGTSVTPRLVVFDGIGLERMAD